MNGIPAHHLEPIAIPPERLARWREAAAALGDAGLSLAFELTGLHADPNRHRLRRAANAARDAERITTGDAQLIANATATELENAAM